MNSKKADLLVEINELYNKDYNRDYLGALRETIAGIKDVDEESLFLSEEWINNVEKDVKVYLEEFRSLRTELVDKRKNAYSLAECTVSTKMDKDAVAKEYDELRVNINRIDNLLNLPERIRLSPKEKQLLHGDVLLLDGKAGIGKSQLLANETYCLLQEKRSVLLLVASIYCTDDPIQEQIMKNLCLDCGFAELVDALETVGERENCIVPIVIDAINETWNKNLWKTGLSLIVDIIKQAPMVRLIVSYRSEYARSLIADSVFNRIEQGDVLNIQHRGFMDNSLDAIKDFMDHYGIPFTPLEYFGYEMSNPLFLTLYCQTYNGEEVSLPELYDRILKRANENVYHSREQHFRDKGYEEDSNIIGMLVSELAEYMSEHDERSIMKEELSNLGFWRKAGLVAEILIPLLVKEHILHDLCFDDQEQYCFAYDQMGDYFCAKSIISKCGSKDAILLHLTEKVLGITRKGSIEKTWNIDLFINVCALYADRFGEECIEIIDKIRDLDDRREVFARYIESLQWRDSRYVNGELTINLIKKYQCSRETLWPMLIGNSVKVFHPLNADFLHEFLSHYDLNRRDYLWTYYINKLTKNDSDRIVQIIQMYDKGKKLSIGNEKQLKLLLTLFGWLLTSSNRWLRDYTSKAMIEILKEHLYLCVYILERFKNVNDPYVVQRMYGIVFGAYTKCKEEDGRELAEYVYEQIFCKEKVYPDILLRDYARLIIEKFLYETDDYKGTIDYCRIIPPYKSDPIPEIEDQHYLEKKYDGAMFWLIHSMTFDGMGLYGDFGRYVFQSALHSFDVDDKEMFNYAVYYIINELGFSEELFGDHDGFCGGYDRFNTAKIERIGKKYQWITMYNMLARISDNCRMIDKWGYPPVEEVAFEGAWEPYVRDFDPTLNRSFMLSEDAPLFKALDEHIICAQQENRLSDSISEEMEKIWLNEKGVFLEKQKEYMVLSDDNGQEWVCLTKYCDTGRKNLDEDKFYIWSWQYAYFGTDKQAKEMLSFFENGISVMTSDIASFHETYVVFNREYPWSPSCNEFEEYAWVDVSIKIDKHKADIEKKIGKLLHATTDLLWEEEYDATKEEAISHSVPCKKLIDVMGLKQLEFDGFFFDEEKKLAAFDTMLTQKVRSVVVRKDVLDEFLLRTGMVLIWITNANKEIHTGDYSISQWSDWEGVMIYDGKGISGDVHRIKDRNEY